MKERSYMKDIIVQSNRTVTACAELLGLDRGYLSTMVNDKKMFWERAKIIWFYELASYLGYRPEKLFKEVYMHDFDTKLQEFSKERFHKEFLGGDNDEK